MSYRNTPQLKRNSFATRLGYLAAYRKNDTHLGLIIGMTGIRRYRKWIRPQVTAELSNRKLRPHVDPAGPGRLRTTLLANRFYDIA